MWKYKFSSFSNEKLVRYKFLQTEPINVKIKWGGGELFGSISVIG